MDKMMLAAAINEASTKEQNPNVPYGVEEIARDAIACAEAGAAIVHFHTRDAVTGEQIWDSFDAYAEAIKLIHRECDVMIYPSFPPMRPKEERFAHVIALAEDPSVKMEVVAFGVGSTNMGSYDPVEGSLSSHANVNTHEDAMYFIESMRSRGIAYNLGVRDVGHLRHIAVYRDMGLVQEPLTVEMTLTERDTYGPYPDAKGLMMYLDMLPKDMRCNWFAVVHAAHEDGAAFRRISMLAAAMGGHVRLGLGDNPLLDGKPHTNEQHVEIVAEMARQAGREVATAADARRLIGLTT